MMTIPLTLAQVASCGYVLFICLMVLKAMLHSTRMLVRVSYLFLSTGAFAGVVTGIESPTFTNALMGIGLALFLAVNERRAPCGLNS